MTGWGEFGIVVAGSLASASILGGVRWLRSRLREPSLEISFGNSPDFNVRLTPEEESSPTYAKLLVVREMRGRQAEAPAVMVEQVFPIPATASPFVPVTLRKIWHDGEHLEPHGHARFVLQEIAFGDDNGRVTVTPSVFSPNGDRVVHMPGDTVYFTVTVRAGRWRRVVARRDLRIVNPWPQPFGYVPLIGPLPDPIPFPEVYEN